jgi:hypothetical protein
MYAEIRLKAPIQVLAAAVLGSIQFFAAWIVHQILCEWWTMRDWWPLQDVLERGLGPVIIPLAILFSVGYGWYRLGIHWSLNVIVSVGFTLAACSKLFS